MMNKILKISAVKGASQAESLNLIPGDIILSYNGTKISSNNELSVLVAKAKYENIENIEIIIVRNGNEIKLKAILEPLGVTCIEELVDLNENEIDNDHESTKALLITLSFLFAIAGVVFFFPSLMSVMAFDSYGTNTSLLNKISTWIFFLCIISFSPMCFISIVSSWFLFNGQSYKKARFASFLPFLNIAIPVSLAMIAMLFNYLKSLVL